MKTSIDIKTSIREKKAIRAVLLAIITGSDMFCGLTIKAANPWLGYKRSKVITHAMEALYKNNRLIVL